MNFTVFVIAVNSNTSF